MDEIIKGKYLNLRDTMSRMGSALVAFSGGVDSTLVLAVGKEVLGDNILAVTVQSPLYPNSHIKNASKIAASLRVEQIVITTDELSNGEFVSNPPERCYLCKHDLFSKLIEIAVREGIAEVVDGTQTDDISDYRPGMEAAKELGIRSPLLEAGFAKYEVRALSRELGLSTWNIPPGPCLASRIPYGQKITREKLRAIEKGEEYLIELGLSQVRLRYIEEKTARIEVSPSSLRMLVEEGVRERVLEKMKSLGFRYVTVDLACYRTGSLNETFEK
jgi:uncharacterized protein